jgi:hypothetical protein
MNKVIILAVLFLNYAVAHDHENEIKADAMIKMNDQCGDQSNLPKETRLFNKIKWKTASEQNNFGYEIYRADTEEGDYSVITEDVIEGAGTTSDESNYEYKDDSIDPCKQYYYYVESISTDGVREAFTPKFPSKIKIHPEK